MILSRLAPLVLLPLVAAGGVHKLKLQKLQPVAHDFAFEPARLAEKYGGQTPLMGTGGAGRNVRLTRPTPDDGLFWAQGEEVNGGHQVPLTSKFVPHFSRALC